LIYVGVNFYAISEVSNNDGKIWPKEVHIEYWMQTKEGWSVELKSIAIHSLGDSVRPITKWVNLSKGPDEMLLLQM
jgi:hypothetical protein